MLRFIISLTLNPSWIYKLIVNLEKENILRETIRDILITPLFANQRSLNLVQKLKNEHNSTVMFDSGGYYVQIGKLTYDELYYPLLKFYRSNQWGDIYTLPDHVPTTKDNEETVWRKVKDTAEFSRLFYLELPSNLKEKAMPVVQGHSINQIDFCLRIYLELGVKHLGFGSFGTFGKNSEVNLATNSAIQNAIYVANIAKKHNIKTHFFGLGAPALVAMIYSAGANSFDSSSWIKAAGFGQIFLPFMRSYNISHRNGRSELQKGITIQKFQDLRKLTGHSCPFCCDIDKLQEQKLYRTLHNLLVIQETVDIINSKKFQKIKTIYENGSPGYRQEYEKWLAIM
jgi:hypothetical protein